MEPPRSRSARSGCRQGQLTTKYAKGTKMAETRKKFRIDFGELSRAAGCGFLNRQGRGDRGAAVRRDN
jgi:hypothetical protein